MKRRRAAGVGFLLAVAVTFGYVIEVHDPNVTQPTPRVATVASTLPPGGLVQPSPSPDSTVPVLPPALAAGTPPYGCPAVPPVFSQVVPELIRHQLVPTEPGAVLVCRYEAGRGLAGYDTLRQSNLLSSLVRDLNASRPFLRSEINVPMNCGDDLMTLTLFLKYADRPYTAVNLDAACDSVVTAGYSAFAGSGAMSRFDGLATATGYRPQTEPHH
jgi:hypothetical protein